MERQLLNLKIQSEIPTFDFPSLLSHVYFLLIFMSCVIFIASYFFALSHRARGGM